MNIILLRLKLVTINVIQRNILKAFHFYDVFIDITIRQCKSFYLCLRLLHDPGASNPWLFVETKFPCYP